MNLLYICKVSAYQAAGNQIDIPKKIAKDFFGASDAVIKGANNMEINVCHINNLTEFVQIEIQPATNPRFSSKLNSFLEKNGDKLSEGDLLVVEKIERSYCIRVIKCSDAKYEPLVDLFDKEEKHALVTASLNITPENLDKVSPDYLPYLAALRTKPFMLLAGISGTGKSRIVREMAKACWKEGDEDFGKNKPSNFEMVQVKPNWHDSSEVFGYVSRIGEKPHFVAGDFLKFVAKAWEHLDKPYFLCLDEMNLAPVEQYFAEYLSVIESRKLADEGKTIYTDPILKKSADAWWWDLCCELTESEDLRIKFRDNGICLPQNLFVIGTVNMDETTYSFSRKVLDRAMTIEMNEVNLNGGLDKNAEKEFSYIEADAVIGTAVEGCDVYTQKKSICDVVLNYLQAVNDKLEGTPFKIAYRTRNEFLVYAVNRLLLSTNEDKDALLKVAMDEMTSMKILSRIEGERSKCVKPLEGIRDVLEETLSVEQQEKSVSLKKIESMLKKGDYISYWD